MTQKDKVKELVGRGLHSYHTKALQQMDRIEKKNKEQNHKISILSNELDNDYLTKTEEGSVVSLEHSKEGMVYLDELQGNTLVNYCTDGSKELTLNGDIDVEGTFITTTEGVDNGKVDVMCEGNTLVNLIKNSTWFNNGSSYIFTEDVIYNPIGKVVTLFNLSDKKIEFAMNTSANLGEQGDYYGSVYVEPFSKDIISIPSGYGIRRIVGKYEHGWNGSDVDKIKDKVVLLDGNYLNIDVSYFEGMKSVGQDDANGHKIEILSHNGNLYDYDMYTKPFGNYLSSHKIHSNGIKVKANNQDTRGCSFIRLYANEDLYISLDIVGSGGVTKKLADNTYIENYIKSNEKVRFKLEKGREYKIELNAGGTYDAEVLYDNIIISKNNYIDFIPRMFNKKEILMNEPLRKANDFYRDRLVKIGNKCYIERNTKEVVLDGTHNVAISGTSVKDETLCRFDFTINGLIKGSNGGEDKKFICDKLPYLFIHALAGGSTNVTQECISNHSTNENSLNMVIKKSRLETIDVTGVNKWLSNNNIKIIIPIATPIYEPLEIEPTLNTYNDITHISNNSIIPCNMKVQNSGYNAIIKPSTLYTIALDTNKSGTIGMNLGGAKGTTTNNVLKLTTPATLTDDSLRLYGKGIKGSKVRLLEGDKTNWIPSHFEGMKSSFEDKLQDDGTYKMEILSNNRNLLPYNNVKISPKTNQTWYDINGKSGIYGSNIDKKTDTCFELKEGYYKISIKTVNCGYQIIDTSEKIMNFNGTTLIPKGRYCIRLRNNNTTDEFGYSEGMITYSNTPIVEYTPRQHNKIQFSLDEPLRKTRDAWDRFVFVDEKLMIERNCIEFVFDGSEDEGWDNSYQRFNKYYVMRCIPSVKIESSWNYRSRLKSSHFPSIGAYIYAESDMDKYIKGISSDDNNVIMIGVPNYMFSNLNEGKEYLKNNPLRVVTERKEPIYEEIPHELQKIILEGYENGTLFFDTNIPPTSIVTYAGETPIVKSVKLNKTEVLNNTNDINDNIIPYLMDMDYRVVCLQLQSEEFNGGVAMARLFGGAYEMLQRDIQSKRYSTEEYRHRLDAYLSTNKITEEEYNKLGDMLNE